jgi:hypothetical protein
VNSSYAAVDLIRDEIVYKMEKINPKDVPLRLYKGKNGFCKRAGAKDKCRTGIFCSFQFRSFLAAPYIR